METINASVHRVDVINLTFVVTRIKWLERKVLTLEAVGSFGASRTKADTGGWVARPQSTHTRLHTPGPIVASLTRCRT